MRHPSLIKQQAAARRKNRVHFNKKPAGKVHTETISNNRSNGILNKIVVKSIVSIVIVAICLWVRDHPLSVPDKVTEPILSLASSTFSFASMQEKWGHYVGFSETSSDPVVYTSDLLYAAPVLSLADSNMTKLGDHLLITASKGENVYATEAGIVLFAGEQENKQVIVIQHADKRQTIYERIVPAGLRPFDHVNRGETIGQVVDDGGFTFSVRDDSGFVDPSTLFLDHEE